MGVAMGGALFISCISIVALFIQFSSSLLVLCLLVNKNCSLNRPLKIYKKQLTRRKTHMIVNQSLTVRLGTKQVYSKEKLSSTQTLSSQSVGNLKSPNSAIFSSISTSAMPTPLFPASTVSSSAGPLPLLLVQPGPQIYPSRVSIKQ